MDGIAFHMRQQQLDHRNVRKRSGQINTSRQELDCGIDQFRFDHVIFLVVEAINMTAGLLQHLRCSDYLSLLAVSVIAKNHCKPRRVRWPFLLCLIAEMPPAAVYTTENVAPIHPTSSPAADIQAGLDIAWQTLFPIMPYIIGLTGVARVAWVVTHKPTAPEYPVYTWALSTIVAAFWLAVRSRETEPAPVEAQATFDPEAIILVFESMGKLHDRLPTIRGSPGALSSALCLHRRHRWLVDRCFDIDLGAKEGGSKSRHNVRVSSDQSYPADT
jgi:hypothetical protein